MKPLLPAALVLLPAITSPAAEAPTNLRATTPLIQGSAFELAWDDNSNDEDEFQFEFSLDGTSDWGQVGTVRKNQTLFSGITGGALGTTYYFRVRANSSASGNSAWSNVASATIPPDIPIWIREGVFAGGTAGAPLTVAAPPTFGAAPTAFTATEMPPGMSIDPQTGELSGSPESAGLYRPRIVVTDGSGEASTFLTLRIKPAPSGPVVHTPVPAALFLEPPGTPLVLDLAGHFHDPDATAVVRIATNLGDLDTILYPQACPASVENFFDYVDRGDYTGVIFHRSAVIATSGVDVVQAGLMKPDGGGDYMRVPTEPGVPDEPGFSNLLGTFAMAKTGQPNSGTSQWYFNTVDNTNLDGPQSNGGYTVFGRATTASLPILADMHSRPRGDYTVMIDGVSQTLRDWPTTVAPAAAVPAPEELIQIQSVTRLADALAYALADNSNPALVAASVSGSELALTPVAGATGIAALTVEVADLDGSVLPVTIDYCLLDLDLTAGLSPDGRLAATFNHEKSPASLSYEVQRSLDGQSWATYWRTSDGLAAPAVVASEDQGARWRITVEDAATAAADTDTALLRVIVTKTN